MQRVIVSLLVVVVIGAALVPFHNTSPNAHAQADLPTWEAADCIYIPQVTVEVDCGYLTVPQVRGDADAGTIRVYVTIFRSPSPQHDPDPLVVLSAGPGVNAVALLTPVTEQMFGPFLASRDVIVFDQRGAGFSEPSLDCAEAETFVMETQDFDGPGEELLVGFQTVLQTCHDQYVADGAIFEGYNSRENAADVNDLATALGYEQINLLGISYGTRVALTVMRDYPDIVRSAVLDSVIPVEVDFFANYAINFQAGLDMLFAECAAQPGCVASFPDLEARFYALLEQLNAEPVLVPVQHPWTRQNYTLRVDGARFVDFMQSNLQKMNIVPVLPYLIYAAEAGEFELFAELYKVTMTVPAVVAEGANSIMWCADEFAHTTPATIEATLDEIHPALSPGHQVALNAAVECSVWELSGEVDPVENQPVVSDIPALLLAGQYDVFAPPHWARQAARNLSNSQVFVVPGGGNNLIGTVTCVDFLAFQFLRDPAEPLDTACMDTLPPVLFFTLEE